jgi:hypothetical protein
MGLVGCVCALGSQLTHGERAFEGQTFADLKRDVALGGHRPKVNERIVSPAVAQLIRECWRTNEVRGFITTRDDGRGFR